VPESATVAVQQDNEHDAPVTRSSVYLETSVISYLAARPSRDILVASRQALPAQWWETRREVFDLVTSQTVIEEAQAGDSQLASRRMSLLADVSLVPVSEASIRLAEALMRRMSLPSHVSADALHIALSATNGVNYLLTWNCTHIANATLRPMIEQECRGKCFEPPIICTPEELMNV
jgi:hypothetical protein